MHFPKGQTPPVNGFWSLTMYDADYFFVANPLNRYTVSARATSSSTTPTARSTSTSSTSRRARTRKSNWLPAPKGKFVLMLRHVLAEGEGPLDPRRHLEDAGR